MTIDAGPVVVCRICGGQRELVVDDGPEPVCRSCIAESCRLALDPRIVAIMSAEVALVDLTEGLDA